MLNQSAQCSNSAYGRVSHRVHCDSDSKLVDMDWLLSLHHVMLSVLGSVAPVFTETLNSPTHCAQFPPVKFTHSTDRPILTYIVTTHYCTMFHMVILLGPSISSLYFGSSNCSPSFFSVVFSSLFILVPVCSLKMSGICEWWLKALAESVVLSTCRVCGHHAGSHCEHCSVAGLFWYRCAFCLAETHLHNYEAKLFFSTDR